MPKRFLEVDHRGIAFHEPGFDHPFSTETSVPPSEVNFCDCGGVGRICHHTYPNGHEVEINGSHIRGMIAHPNSGLVPQVSRENFRETHSKPGCYIRRQIFVDVTDRPDAQLGMYYDEKTDTFSKVTV